MAMSLHPFQLLELNVISAQDLFQTSRNMKTYAVSWVHPDRKLSTRVDTTGRANPTWNDKFVFRVDEEFLRADTSAIMVEIYALHWFRDVLVGTVRVIVGNLLPPSIKSHRGRGQQQHVGMRFVALQVWRLSGRPQGILNVGATVLDSSMRSMPLYTQLSSSAVGYRDLMGEEDPLHHHRQTDEDQPNPNYTALKPILRRTRSDRSELERKPALEVKGRKANVKSGSELGITFPGKKTGGSSVLSGSDIIFYRKEVPKTTTRVKSGGADPTPKKTVNEKVVAFEGFDPPAKKAAVAKQGEFIKNNNNNGNYYWPGFITNNKAPANQKMMTKNNSILSFSDVGPSPSEMAAIVAQRYPTEPSNSAVEGWSVDESVEGLRSKLERWRMELPPVYDPSSGEDSKRSLAKHRRRHTDGGATTTAAAGSGLFSCFGNVFGYECSCVCGKPPGGTTTVPVTSKEVASSRMQSPWVQH